MWRCCCWLSCRCHTNVGNFCPECQNVVILGGKALSYLATQFTDDMVVPAFFFVGKCQHFTGLWGVLHMGHADIITIGITMGIPWTWDMPAYYHQDGWVGHLLIPAADTSAATTSPATGRYASSAAAAATAQAEAAAAAAWRSD